MMGKRLARLGLVFMLFTVWFSPRNGEVYAGKKTQKIKQKEEIERLTYVNDLILLKQGEKFGLETAEGERIVPIIYDEIYQEYNFQGNIILRKGKKYGLAGIGGKPILPALYEEIRSIQYDSPHFLIKMKGKWGVVKSGGKTLIKPLYDEITSLGGDLFVVRNKTKSSIFHTGRKKWIPGKYDALFVLPEELDLIAVRKNKKWGFLKKNGRLLVEPTYQNYSEYLGNGLLGVMKKGKWALMDKTGKIHGKFEYDDLYSYYDPERDAVYYGGTKGEETSLYDKNRKKFVTFPGNKIITYYREKGLAIVCNVLGQSALVNEKGETFVPYTYDSITMADIERNLVRVERYYGYDTFYGYYDLEGNKLFPIEHREILPLDAGGEKFAVELNGKYGVWNRKKEVILPFRYDGIKSFDQKKGYYLLFQTREDGTQKRGVINEKGEIIAEPVYEEVETVLGSEFFKVSKKDKADMMWGLIDKTGEVLLPLRYSSIGEFNKDGFILIEERKGDTNKVGVANLQLRFVLPIAYDNIEFWGKLGFGLERYDMKEETSYHGYANIKGEVILPANYIGVRYLSGDRLVAGKYDKTAGEERYGLFDTEGRAVLPIRFSGIYEMDDGYLKFAKEEEEKGGLRYALADEKGEFLTEFLYSEMGYFNQGKVAVKLGKNWGYLDRQGTFTANKKAEKEYRYDIGE